MIKKLKKGFTLVELIVVIAIIAILSTVAVIGYTRVVDKANVSNDTQLVRNLNERMQLEEAATGYKRPETAHEAFLLTEDFGYVVEKLTPTSSGNDIVWDSTTNRFALIDAEHHTKVVYSDPTKDLSEDPINLWKVFKEVPSDPKYSIYLAGTNLNGSVDAKVGVDVGKNLGITAINYTNTSGNDKNVVIRTNSFETTLKINAPLDTVHHHGEAASVVVTAIASASYHEFGSIKGKATISAGHFVVEKDAEVPQVEVVAATSAVKITASESTLINVDTESASQATVVANSADVYVTGISAENIFGPQASSVELPTVVTSEGELISAISASKGFIQIGSNFNATQAHTFGFNSLIDFAGHTIESSLMKAAFITNNAKMRLIDSKSGGGINSTNNNLIINKGTLTIDGGRFAGNREYTIGEATAEGFASRGVIHNVPNATLTINGITLYTKTDFGVLNYGTTTINGGTYTSHSETNGSTNGSRRYSYTVTSYAGNIIINNATVNGVHGGIGINGGKGTVNNATVVMDTSKNSFYALYIAGSNDVVEATINGGTFNPGSNGKCLYVGNQGDGGLGRVAVTTVNGGTFNGGIYVSESSNYGLGILKVNGGTFAFNPSSYLAEGHTATQDGNTWVVQ